MSTEYKAGTYVVYDSYGICKISGIEKISFSRNSPKQNYYVLSPIGSTSSTYYVPVSGQVADKKIRLPMTELQIKSILSEALCDELKWIDNRQARLECFSRILSSGISADLVRLIRCIFIRREHLIACGKKLSSTDETVFSSAEKMLKEEFAFSLGISPDDVTEYIRNFIDTSTN